MNTVFYRKLEFASTPIKMLIRNKDNGTFTASSFSGVSNATYMLKKD